jgi:hypothetical protein
VVVAMLNFATSFSQIDRVLLMFCLDRLIIFESRRLRMETQDSWQEWMFVGGYLALLAFVTWGVLIRK